jgi:hypothetical protein
MYLVFGIVLAGRKESVPEGWMYHPNMVPDL